MRIGQIIWQTRTLPRTDLFSFTQFGQSWTNQSWLAELIFYVINQLGGLPLTLLCHGAILALSLYIYQHSLYRLTRSVVAVVSGGLILILLTFEQWMLRPQIFSILGFALLVALISRSREHPRRVWLALPLFLVWANLHGGFIFGLALLGMHTLVNMRTSPWRMGVLAGAVLACAVTPLGPFGMVDYVFSFVNHEITRKFNPEFARLDFWSPLGQRVLAVTGVLFVLLYWERNRVRSLVPVEILLGLGVFGVAGLLAVRNLLWFGFFAGATISLLLAARLTDMPKRWSPAYRLLNLLLLAAVVLSIPALRPALPATASTLPLTDRETPVEMVTKLCQNSQVTARHTFNQLAFGSYMIWACPDWPVFIDTRMELFPPDQWYDYAAVVNGQEGWQAVLDSYDIDALLLHTEVHRSLIQQVDASPCWRIRNQDAIATYAVRTSQCILD